jgi:flagellar biosynthesis/type III secretory pathway M-ring protein FliF/YscJ
MSDLTPTSIALIVLGVIVVVLFILIMVFFYVRRRKRTRNNTYPSVLPMNDSNPTMNEYFSKREEEQEKYKNRREARNQLEEKKLENIHRIMMNDPYYRNLEL